MNNIGYTTVSYTHLDVYKRQGFNVFVDVGFFFKAEPAFPKLSNTAILYSSWEELRFDGLNRNILCFV